jgi:hypothetical protein
VIRRLLRLYPRRWRERYGDELEDLVAATGMSPGIVLDLIAGALGEQVRSRTLRTAGGPSMTSDRPGWGSTLLAVAGFLALVPTLLFMSFSVLLYNLEVPIEAIRPVIEVAVSIAPVNVGFAVLPFVALAVAAAPLVRLSIGRGDARREVIARIGVRPMRSRLPNVFVAGLALAAILALLVYQVTENML